ncbi:glycosyltransferase family 2 protein [Candidatus Saccharibacteria bacterium]|nr:glycosyltransferase family 2 protein [Candidatus Saccharibacteria bacterium]
MKSIAVLLTVFNRKEKTLQCLSNLFKQEIPEGYFLDVYLTNDGCTDGTPEAVKERFPQVKIINGDGNLFWNRGMWTAWNVASKTKEYDFYLWLNDDTFLYDGAISKLLETSQKYEDKSIIVGATESLDKTHTTYGGRIPIEGIPKVNGVDSKCFTFNGNIVLIPKYVFDSIGKMDSYYSHCYGDIDYGYTATKRGIAIYQVGEHLGACDEHPTLSNWCNPNVPLRKRWIALHRPNGQPPKEVFHFESKFLGIGKATFHYFTTCLHCFFPQLWEFLGKARK